MTLNSKVSFLLTIFLLLTLFVSVEASQLNTYYCKASPLSCETPKVVLQSGTAGASTIYMDNTSAKVRVQPSWYDPIWDYRKKITINHTRVQADLTAFPVLINLDFDSDLASRAQINGNDILFTSSDGVIKLSHEIEKFTSGTGELVAWVKVLSLSSSVDTVLYMYYGNPTCGSQQDATNVWDSNFKGVWHLKEDPSGTAPQMKDSTSNGNNGTSYGFMTTSDQVTGKINGSLDFDGSNDEIQCGSATSLQITTAVTIEAWVKRPSTVAIYAGIAGKLVNGGGNNYKGYNIQKHDTTNKYRFAIGAGSSLDTACVSDSAYTDTNWHYIVGVRRAGTNYLYVDGVQQAATSTQAITDSGADFDIGRQYTDYNGRWWSGIIDEVRVSNIGRSAGWIATCYNNQNSPNTFYSVGSNTQDFVDNNTSDVDSSADKGTHGNFSAQQYGPDSINDILTESGGTTETTITANWGADVSSGGTKYPNDGSDYVGYSATSYRTGNKFPLTSLPSGATVTKVEVIFRCSQAGGADHLLDIHPYNGNGQADPETDSGSNMYTRCASGTAYVNDATFLRTTGVKTIDLGSQACTDVMNAKTAVNRFSLGWQEEGDNSAEARLAEYTDATNPPKLRITYVASCELDLEVQWTNVDCTQNHEELCIYGGAMDAENIRVDVWNGSSWVNLFANLNLGWNNVSVSSYLSSQTFTIRFKGGNETGDTIQDSWNIDATLLHVWATETYDYVLKVINLVAYAWKVNLKVYASSNIARISSTIISFHDGTSSDQISISSGVITQSEGALYDLVESTTIYISMSNVQAPTYGTSYIYVYLKVLKPSTSTYSLFIITFEIT